MKLTVTLSEAKHLACRAGEMLRFAQFDAGGHRSSAAYRVVRRIQAAVVGILLALALAGCSGGLAQVDVEQERLDTPSSRVESADAIAQTFVAHANGLAGVEVLLAVYPDPPPQGAL